MSDIADISTYSDISPPLYTSTINSKNVNSTQISTPNQYRIMNNMKANTDNNFISEKNNHNLREKNNNDYTEKSTRNTMQDNRPLKLKVVITDQNRVMNVLNDLSKPQSPMAEKNSMDSVGMEKEEAINKGRTNKPIMGRTALLKKANIEANDSLIIYDLITEKYNGLINHYLERSSQRRRLRTESSDNFSDTVYSSPPAYSPWSVSSIGTPGSVGVGRGVDEKTGFQFPIPVHPTGRTSNQLGMTLDDTKEEFSNDQERDRDYLRFITSTDNSNKETTIEDIDSSVNLTRTTEKSNSSFSDYDPKKFLDNAIGELTNLSLAYGIPHNTEQKNTSDRHQETDSIQSSNISALISRAGSLCVLAASKINTKKPQPMPTQLAEIFENKRLSLNSDNPYLETLMKELSLQTEIMFQVSKALNYCRNTKKFESSAELLEAERILLIASCTKEALTIEIQNVDDDTYEKHDDTKCCGEVTLSNLTFHPKDTPKTDGHREFTEHFVVIFTCGSVVLASEVITADDKGAVHVNKKLHFPNLAPDFEISVCIYAMRVAHNQHVHQNQKTNCPSPKKIFLHLKKCSKKSKVLNDVVYIKPSSFTLWGRCEIRSRDISKTKNNTITTLHMSNTPLTSSLSGAFSVKINTSVKLTNKTSGFLTIGTDNEHGCTIWNRRWCVLEGSNLKYWNYPSEEVSKPFGSINMCNCLDRHVHLAARSICARPRTLMLPIRQNEIEKKYLLSADSCLSLEEWEKEINNVLCSLRLWNSLNILQL